VFRLIHCELIRTILAIQAGKPGETIPLMADEVTRFAAVCHSVVLGLEEGNAEFQPVGIEKRWCRGQIEEEIRVTVQAWECRACGRRGTRSELYR
jgi:hypothetical protein